MTRRWPRHCSRRRAAADLPRHVGDLCPGRPRGCAARAGRVPPGHAPASGEGFLTHNYVLVESLALIQHRLGAAAAVKLAESASDFEVVWVDRKLHEEAARRLARAGRHRVSFVDHVSFLVMRSRGIEKALAFDPDFVSEGFDLFS